jgi:hypothetical protein
MLLLEHDIENFGEEGHIQLNMNEHGHGSLASLEKWHNYNSGGMLDQLCSSSCWFNSWTCQNAPCLQKVGLDVHLTTNSSC